MKHPRVKGNAHFYIWPGTPSHLSKLSFLHAATFASNNTREEVVEESESKSKFEEKRKDFF